MGVQEVVMSLLLFMIVLGIWRLSRQKGIDESLEHEKRLAELNRLDAREGRFQGRTGPRK